MKLCRVAYVLPLGLRLIRNAAAQVNQQPSDITNIQQIVFVIKQNP